MAKNKTANKDTVEINLPGTEAAGFGDDELGQIRALLFGRHAQQTLERIERVEHQLLDALSQLSQRVDDRFSEVDLRISADAEAQKSAAAGLGTRIDDEFAQRREADMDLRAELDRSAVEIRKQLGDARTELTTRLERVDADLRERNVDRESLASFFSEAATSLNVGED